MQLLVTRELNRCSELMLSTAVRPWFRHSNIRIRPSGRNWDLNSEAGPWMFPVIVWISLRLLASRSRT